MNRFIMALLGLALLVSPVAAADFEGMARVIDADKIVVDDQRIKLYGVEAVERPQACNLNGREWDCHAVSIRQLEIMVANEPVQCDQVGERDFYARVFAKCMIGGQDLGEMFIRAGWAMVRRIQTEEYVAAEDAAREEGIGLWESAFVPPWVWREQAGVEVDDP